MEIVSGLAEQLRVEKTFHRFFLQGDSEEISQLLDEYGCRPGDQFQAAIIAPANAVKNEWSSRQELLDLSIKSVCIEQIEYHRHGITFRDKTGLLVVLLFCGPGHPDSLEQAEQLQVILQNEYGLPQRVYLGSVVGEISRIPDSYREALQLWRDNGRSQSVVQVWKREGLTGRVENMMQSFRQELGACLGNRELALQVFDGCWEELQDSHAPLSTLRSSCFHLLNDTYYLWMKETGGSVEQEMVNLLIEIQTAAQSEIYQIGRRFLQRLLAGGQGGYEDVIASAKQYISRHLDRELSVAELAGQFYLSVAYFSKLFKKTEGVGCNYYIMCQRMERAKELLQQGQLRVREVSQQVGYKDVSYFSLTFKKYAGVTPAEYREQG